MSREIVAVGYAACPDGGEHINRVKVEVPTEIIRVLSWNWLSVCRNEGGFFVAADGQKAAVDCYRCPCGHEAIRTEPDSTTANNLASLPRLD